MSSAQQINTAIILCWLVIFLLLSNCAKKNAMFPGRTVELDSLLRLSSQLITNQQYDSSKTVLKMILNASADHQQETYLAKARYNLALVNYYQNEIDKGIENISFAIRVYENELEHKRLARSKQLLGLFFNIKGLNQRAISAYLEALEFAQSDLDSANLYMAIGNIYHATAAYQNSIKQYKIADLLIQSGNHFDDANISYLWNNIGLSFLHLNQMDSAKTYLLSAIEQNERNASQSIAPFNNLGLLYNNGKNPDSAIHYLHKAQKLIRPNTKLAAKITTYTLIGEAHRLKKDFLTSATYLNKGLNLLAHLEKLDGHAEHYKYQKRLANSENNFEKALYWDNKLDSVKNIIFDKQRLSIQQIASDYELEQANMTAKEAILLKQQEQQTSTTRLYFVLLLSAFSALLLILMFLIIKQRSRLSILNMELKKNNKLIKTINTQNLHFSKNSHAENASMIAMKIRQIEDQQIKNVLQGEQTRNLTINTLFQTLFLQTNKSDSQSVELSTLLQNVVDQTIEAIMPIDHDVVVKYDLDHYHTDQQMALPISLIANEITFNACKYAFNGEGQFHVGLSQYADHIELTFGDNGPGTSKTNHIKIGSSFGFKMIDNLSMELNAEMRRSDDEQGLSYYFTIPITQHNE